MTTWRPLDFDELRSKLVRVRELLEQAAAVGLARDAERLESASQLAERAREQHTRDGKPRHRRYR